MLHLQLKKNVLELTVLLRISFLILILSACGGNSNENTPPTIEILDVNFFYFVTDTVDPSKRTVEVVAEANDIDGDISSIDWTILSNHEIDLIDADTKIVRFTSPLTNSEEIDLFVLEVEVTDNKGSKTTDTVEIDLNDDLLIFIPLISAIRREEVKVNALVLGRKSKISGFNWSVANGVDITLLDANTDTVTFIAPPSTTISEVKLVLEVSFMDGCKNQIFDVFVTLGD